MSWKTAAAELTSESHLADYVSMKDGAVPELFLDEAHQACRKIVQRPENYVFVRERPYARSRAWYAQS